MSGISSHESSLRFRRARTGTTQETAREDLMDLGSRISPVSMSSAFTKLRVPDLDQTEPASAADQPFADQADPSESEATLNNMALLPDKDAKACAKKELDKLGLMPIDDSAPQSRD